MDNFILVPLNVSKERLYLSCDKGGLGCFNVKDFLIAQQVCWLKKANFKSRDNWSYDLKRLSSGNILAISSSDIDKERHPILSSLVDSFEIFKKKFYSKDNNILKLFVINNPLLCRGFQDGLQLNANFFRQNPPIDNVKLFNLTFEEIRWH